MIAETDPTLVPRRIVIVVYGPTGRELSRKEYAGSAMHVNALDETLVGLFRLWNSQP